jgi:hypothetical protein
MTLQQFTGWLNDTQLSLTLKTTSWLIPVSQSIHILCVAVVMSAVLLTSLRLLGVSARHHPLTAFHGRFLPWVWGAYVVLITTGVLQIIAEPGRALPNPFFQIKMALFVVVMSTTLAFQRAAPSLSTRPGTGAIRHAGVLSVTTLILLLVIITCGRWIAYSDRF